MFNNFISNVSLLSGLAEFLQISAGISTIGAVAASGSGGVKSLAIVVSSWAIVADKLLKYRNKFTVMATSTFSEQNQIST